MLEEHFFMFNGSYRMKQDYYVEIVCLIFKIQVSS